MIHNIACNYTLIYQHYMYELITTVFNYKGGFENIISSIFEKNYFYVKKNQKSVNSTAEPKIIQSTLLFFFFEKKNSYFISIKIKFIWENSSNQTFSPVSLQYIYIFLKYMALR